MPISPEDPFIGELKCIAVDEIAHARSRATISIGEVLIGASNRSGAGDRSGRVQRHRHPGACQHLPEKRDLQLDWHALSQRLRGPARTIATTTLVLGRAGASAEYEGCPNILILDHYFDGAVDPVVTNLCQPDGTCSVSGTPCINDNECVDNICRARRLHRHRHPCAAFRPTAKTPAIPTNVCTLSGEHCLHDEDCTIPTSGPASARDLTLVPCTEDFKNQRPELSKTTAQFLVFNEFEQRLSTSIPIECFKEIAPVQHRYEPRTDAVDLQRRCRRYADRADPDPRGGNDHGGRRSPATPFWGSPRSSAAPGRSTSSPLQLRRRPRTAGERNRKEPAFPGSAAAERLHLFARADEAEKTPRFDLTSFEARGYKAGTYLGEVRHGL